MKWISCRYIEDEKEEKGEVKFKLIEQNPLQGSDGMGILILDFSYLFRISNICTTRVCGTLFVPQAAFWSKVTAR